MAENQHKIMTFVENMYQPYTTWDLSFAIWNCKNETLPWLFLCSGCCMPFINESCPRYPSCLSITQLRVVSCFSVIPWYWWVIFMVSHVDVNFGTMPQLGWGLPTPRLSFGDTMLHRHRSDPINHPHTWNVENEDSGVRNRYLGHA